MPTLRVDAATADRSRHAYPAPPRARLLPPGPPRPALAARRAARRPLRGARARRRRLLREDRRLQLIGVALSGGRDSLLTLLVAWHAIGRSIHADLARDALAARMKPALHAFYMPTRFSSEAPAPPPRGSPGLGASSPCSRSRRLSSASPRRPRAMLGPEGPAPTAITEQNVQARIRGPACGTGPTRAARSSSRRGT